MNIIFCSKHNDSSSIDPQIVNTIKVVLDDVNHFVKQYRVASTLIQTCNMFDFKLRLIGVRKRDGCTYNLPTTSEVAALIVGDLDDNYTVRDILVHSRNDRPQQISELHASYLPLK